MKTTYFDTQAQALDYAYEDARKRGYEVVMPNNPVSFFGHIEYIHTKRYTFDLTKDGKEQKKCLHVILYRMDSGWYELTHYIQ
jgi:hypothetical protein